MALPRLVKAVVFDMDGLLVDSESLYRDALIATAGDMGVALPLDVVKRMIGHTWPGSARVLADHFGAAFDTDRLRTRSVERFYELAEAGVALKSGVREILDYLDQAGLPRGVVTSSRRKEVEHHLGDHGLLERFHFILAQGEYPRPKPDPAPYQAAAERLGLDPGDCLALEDSHNGVRAAAAAGMMTIMVPDLLDPTDEMHALCIRIAADLHEVRALLEAQGAS
ncbi:MAG: hydrolase, haloacid dehalogenase-like family [Phenylobacterium sp.]|nr:hydrolase, haloacid dehalogenase-like family [Phenylobacterium sp.]MDB5493648.1 hydrolase, haloacid dehalogenase-like family [Phenylobacterium sp.]